MNSLLENEIGWMVELAIRAGQWDAFTALTTEMVAHTRTEDGVVFYERYGDESERRVVVLERYRDSGAAIAHLDAFHDRFAARFNACAERRQAFVLGVPNAALRERLLLLDPAFMQPLAGFSSRE